MLYDVKPEKMYVIVRHAGDTNTNLAPVVKYLVMENAWSDDRWFSTEYAADRYPLAMANNLFVILKERYAGDLNITIEESK